MWLTSDQFASLEGEKAEEEEAFEHFRSPGLSNERYRWPNNIVYYQLENSFTSKEKAIIDDVLDSFEEKLDSCIRFKKRYSWWPWPSDRVNVRQNDGCSSRVGYRGGTQTMSLSPKNGCLNRGSIEHEFMHALGIYHTQARTDRDSYVKIHFENVDPAQKVNFNKQTGTSTFGLPYDFGSVMHYGEKAWSRNGLRVIETLDPSKQVDTLDSSKYYFFFFFFQTG